MNENITSSVITFVQSRIGKKPERAHATDAGIDFFIPKFTSSFIKDLIDKNKYLLDQTEPIWADVIGEESIDVEKDLNIISFDVKEKLLCIELKPHERILIPSGIYCQMESHNRALIAANKSGVATRHGLVFGAQVVDSSYQGEIHISVINTSDDIIKLYEDMKIIQFVETPIYTSAIQFEDSISNLFKLMPSTRGDGGFGSSDKKMLSE